MEFKTQSLIILLVGIFAGFYILYLIIKGAVQSGTSEMLYELKKLNGEKETDNLSIPRPSTETETDPDIIKYQKKKKRGETIAMVVLLVVIFIIVLVVVS
jgi:preprotein translocase subunit YajC